MVMSLRPTDTEKLDSNLPILPFKFAKTGKEKDEKRMRINNNMIRVRLYREGHKTRSTDGYCAAYLRFDNINKNDDSKIQWSFECNGKEKISQQYVIKNLIQKDGEYIGWNNLFKINDITQHDIQFKVRIISSHNQHRNSDDNNNNINKQELTLKEQVEPWYIGQKIIVQISDATNNNYSNTMKREATIRDYNPCNKLTQIWFETEDNHFENVDLLNLDGWDIANHKQLHEQIEFVPDNNWIPIYWKMGQRVLVRFDGKFGNGSQFAGFIDGYDPISRRHHVNYGETSEWIWATKERVEIYYQKCQHYIEEKIKIFKENGDKIKPPPWNPKPYGLNHIFDDKSKEIEENRLNQNNINNKKELNDSIMINYSTHRKRKRIINDRFDEASIYSDTPPPKKQKIDNNDNDSIDDDDDDSDVQISDITLAAKHIKECAHCRYIHINACILGHHHHHRNEDKKNLDDFKLNPEKRALAIKWLAKKLDIEPMMPSIDCFASHQNYQRGHLYITAFEDFFSSQYDCSILWSYLIFWANSPYFAPMLIKSIETFEKRKMRGYMCGPYYLETENQHKNRWFDEKAIKCCKAYVDIGGINDVEMYYPVQTGNKAGFRACPFNTIVCYFDFRESK